jgi:hypothetical protein
MEFDYLIEYKKGQENKAADALSCQEHLAAITTITPAWTEDVENTYRQDTVYQQLIAQLTVGTTPPSHYTFSSRIIRYGRIVIGLDNVFRNKLLDTFHSSPIGGHSGIWATYQCIKCIFFWPQLKKDVEAFIQTCPTCQRSKGEHCKYPGMLVPLPIPNMAWQHI